MGKIKFEFGIDFQELILKYTVTEKKGYKLLELYDDTYFVLTPHAVIAYGLKKYYKKKKRVPEETYLRETLRSLDYSQKDVFENVTDEDRASLDNIITKLYSGTVADATLIVEKCINFARYVKFKEEMEKIDINRYDSYEQSLNKLRDANNIGSTIQEDYGVLVVEGIKERAHKRDQLVVSQPTPFWQFNKLLNSGGTTKGNVILIAAEAKRFKTGFMINVCRYLMRRKRKVIYFDLENGQNALVLRAEQSIIRASQMEVASGELDERLLKVLRKYRRLGAEMMIKRMPAYQTTTDDLQAYLDKVKRDLGLTFTDCVIDFPDLMASLSGTKEDTQRISDAYVDVKNFAELNQFDSTFVASHVTREAAKRRGTIYIQNDLAKCIDKMRHVDIALGLQENEEEMQQGVIRMEIMEQRNGGKGRMYFWVNFEKQLMTEFNHKEVKAINKQVEENQNVEKKSDL